MQPPPQQGSYRNSPQQVSSKDPLASRARTEAHLTPARACVPGGSILLYPLCSGSNPRLRVGLRSRIRVCVCVCYVLGLPRTNLMVGVPTQQMAPPQQGYRQPGYPQPVQGGSYAVPVQQSQQMRAANQPIVGLQQEESGMDGFMC